ncbi:MAG: hypothetical protein ABI442_13040, partial [Gemmatimonadaceae bacterium]
RRRFRAQLVSVYSTCLFCNGQLGKNDAIEHFPVGRRLAFDGAKGRLWVVCRKCERWNLTPLEERWEAIEECERFFRETRLRVSTDHIGLARLKEWLELVRIGEPQRPEMAAWRYGDQFGRRRRRHYAIAAGGLAVVGTVVIAGPMMGLISIGSLGPMWNVINAGTSLYRSRRKLHLTTGQGRPVRVRLMDVRKAKLYADGDGIVLRVLAEREGPSPSRWKFDSRREEIDLTGDHAVRAAGTLLTRLNQAGGSSNDVTEAVRRLESAGDPHRLFRQAADLVKHRDKVRFGTFTANALSGLPTASRLALEMAAHEDSERRALEGELHILEDAWRTAEEIAGISDDMFVPASVDEELERLRKERSSE